MGEKRRFENDDKFWEVWLDGTQVMTHFGANGANGQTRLKPTKDAAAAEEAMADMIKKKKKEGYAQTGGAKLASGPKLDEKQLKKHLGALKDAMDPAVLVLADWLQTQQHPWGELIALQYNAAAEPKKAAALEKAANKLLEDKSDEILGELAGDKLVKITAWKSGFAQTAVIGSDAVDKDILSAVKKFLANPLGKVVEKVVLSPVQQTFTPWQDWGDSMANVVDPWGGLEAIASALPDRITQLGFGEWPAQAAAGYTRLPSFTKVSKAFPKLTKLEMAGSALEKMGKLSLPELTELTVHFANAESGDLAAIAGSKLPKLERITVGLGGSTHAIVDEVQEPDEYDYEEEDDDDDSSRYSAYGPDDMEGMNGYGDLTAGNSGDALFDASLAKTVTHLGLSSSAFSDATINSLAKSKLLKQLKTLDLSDSRFTEDALKALIKAKKSFAHLEEIDLRKSGLDAKALVKVKDAFPNATVDKGKKAGEEKGPSFFFRYLATME